MGSLDSRDCPPAVLLWAPETKQLVCEMSVKHGEQHPRLSKYQLLERSA